MTDLLDDSIQQRRKQCAIGFAVFYGDFTVGVQDAEVFVVGNFAQNGQVIFFAECFGGVGAWDGFVDDDTKGLVKKRDQIVHHAKVVCAKEGGLGNQQAKVGVFDALHDNAGAARGAVDNGEGIGRRSLKQQVLDNGNACGLTDMEDACVDAYIVGAAGLDDADFFVDFAQRLLGTQKGAQVRRSGRYRQRSTGCL